MRCPVADLPPWLLGNAYQRAINMAAALRINGMPPSNAGNLCCIVHECHTWGAANVNGVWACDAHAASVQAAIEDMVTRANAGTAPVVLELAQRIRVATPEAGR